MSNLNRIERTSVEHRRRALRRAEREDMLRVIGDDDQMSAPDSTIIAVSSRDNHDQRPNDPRSSL
jgi:hypothetical protein